MDDVELDELRVEFEGEGGEVALPLFHAGGAAQDDVGPRLGQRDGERRARVGAPGGGPPSTSSARRHGRSAGRWRRPLDDHAHSRLVRGASAEPAHRSSRFHVACTVSNRPPRSPADRLRLSRAGHVSPMRPRRRAAAAAHRGRGRPRAPRSRSWRSGSGRDRSHGPSSSRLSHRLAPEVLDRQVLDLVHRRVHAPSGGVGVAPLRADPDLAGAIPRSRSHAARTPRPARTSEPRRSSAPPARRRRREPTRQPLERRHRCLPSQIRTLSELI